MLAEHRLPGPVVTDRAGRPRSILPASQVVQFLVPSYVPADPAPASVLDEPMADRIADKLSGRAVRDVIPQEAPELAVVESDDTIIEVAAMTAALRCPPAAVVAGDTPIGVITASRLRQLALTPR